MPHVKQLVPKLQSKAGVLVNVAGVLGQAGVNIEGICAAKAASRGKIRLLVSDLATAEAALKATKIGCGRQEAVTVSGEPAWRAGRGGAEAGPDQAQRQVCLRQDGRGGAGRGHS